MNKKRLLFFFLVLLIVDFLVLIILLINWKPIKSNRDLPEIMTDSTLNVVTEYNYADLQASNDYIAGFHYELCQYISLRSGLTIQNHFENDLEIAIQKLEENVYDVIAQNILITNENREFLALTVPIGQTRQVLVQRKKNDEDSVLFISNQLDLADKTIYVTKNSPAIMRLNNLSEEIAEPIYINEVSGFTSEELFYMVTRREIDYFATDIDNALKNTGLFPDLDFNTDISFTQLQAWAVRKTSPVLLDSLNVWIEAFRQQNGKR